MTEEKKPKKLPINYMANEFMDQQLTTLDKNKQGGKKDATTNADGSNGTTS